MEKKINITTHSYSALSDLVSSNAKFYDMSSDSELRTVLDKNFIYTDEQLDELRFDRSLLLSARDRSPCITRFGETPAK